MWSGTESVNAIYVQMWFSKCCNVNTFCLFFRNDAYNVATAIDPLSLSLQQLRWLLHLRGVSYHKAIEKKDLTDLVSTSGVVTKVCFKMFRYDLIFALN